MATLVWFTGCEAGPPTPNDNTGVGREFTALSKGGAVSPSIVTTPVRTGTYALKLPTDGAARGSMGTYASNATTFWRGYFYIAGNPTNAIIILGAGSNLLALSSTKFLLWLNTNGTLGWDFNTPAISGGPVSSGATPVTLNAWNLIEIKFLRDAAAGGMEIKLNGVIQVSQFDRATTTGTSLTTMTIWPANDAKQPGTGQSGQDMYWDDMAFGFGGYIGAGQSIAVQGKAGAPTYDAFTKNGGATAAENWSETPWSGTKNCTSSTIAQRQTMLIDDVAMAAAVPASATINAAIVLGVIKIVTSGNCRITRRVGGVDTDSATKVLSTVDQVIPEGLDHTMDAFVPTRAQLVSGTTEIGVVANSTNLLTVEDMWILVDFVPPAAPGLTRDESLPVEWLTGIFRDETLLVDASSPANLIRRDELLPVELFSNNFFIVRDEKLPVEFTGGPQGSLLLIWNVREKLFAPFVLQWNVISRGLVQTFQLKWNVRSNLAYLVPFVLRWNVIPNLVTTLINDDIQLPTLTITKTP